MGKAIEYKNGQIVNGLIYLYPIDEIKTTPQRIRKKAVFVCVCGREFISRLDHVVSKNTTSCGCIQKEMATKSCLARTTHGESRRGKISPEFYIWCGIKSRCLDANSQFYDYYGGRGIFMDANWVDSFENFLNDVGRRPSPKHTLDRIENNDGYYKNNCRWATKKQQANNRRSNINITFNGQTMTLMQWAEKIGVNYGTLRCNIVERDWSFEKAYNKYAK